MAFHFCRGRNGCLGIALRGAGQTGRLRIKHNPAKRGRCYTSRAPESKTFSGGYRRLVPAAIGVDCSASLSIDSGFASEDNVRYYAVLGRFSACDGSQSSSPRISLRTFRTVPCKPRYAEEESTKSCGGPLDDPESEELHHSLEVPVAALSKIFDILREKGVQLSYRYDLQITTAARMVSKAEEFEIPGQLEAGLV